MGFSSALYGLSGFLAGLLIWAAFYAAKKGRERRANAGVGESDKLRRHELPPVRWLDGEDSPTGRRVLDCRAFALGVQLWTQDKTAVAKFHRVSRSDGGELDGQRPVNAWLVDVDWRFDSEQAEQIGLGMRPQTTEDMWLIDCRDDRLYFRRSWTGQLVFMSNWFLIPTAGATISRIWVSGDEPFGDRTPDYVAAYVRHLIDTHLLNTLTPFPIPPDFPPDDRKIAAFVFHSVGRRGWLAEYFATAENKV
jgi:hypothetical protein